MNWWKRLWGGLSNSENQRTLAFIGAGLVIVVSAGWQAYLHLSKSEADKSAPPITATQGGIAAGGNIAAQAAHGGTAIIQTGPNSTAQHIENYYGGITDKRFQTLAEELGVTKAALTSFFQILEQKQVPLTDLDSTLRAIAQRYQELQAKLTGFNSEDEAVEAIKRQAKEALDRGDFDRAEALLNHASAKDVSAAKTMQANASKRLLRAAAAKAEAGDVKNTQLAYLAAAAYYRQAAQLVPPGEDVALAGYLTRQGNALYMAGRYPEARPILERALALRKQVLGPAHPDVATSLNDLALLYKTQGEYADAASLYQRSLKIRENDTILHNLGSTPLRGRRVPES